MSSLRSKAIRLAYQKPELRSHLLPMIRDAAWVPSMLPAPFIKGKGGGQPTEYEIFLAVKKSLFKNYKQLEDNEAVAGDLDGEIEKLEKQLEQMPSESETKKLQDEHKADLESLKQKHEKDKKDSKDPKKLETAYNKAVADKQTEFKQKVKEVQKKDTEFGETRAKLKEKLRVTKNERKNLDRTNWSIREDVGRDEGIFRNFGVKYDYKAWEEGVELPASESAFEKKYENRKNKDDGESKGFMDKVKDFFSGKPTYEAYVERKKQEGARPLPKDEWEKRVVGK